MAVKRSVLDQVWKRDESRCFICASGLTRNEGGYSVHHRRARKMGGSKDPVTNTPANLLLLCGSGTTGCHGVVERKREWSILNGYLVLAGHNPAQVPVDRWMSHMVYLTPDGDVVFLPMDDVIKGVILE